MIIDAQTDESNSNGETDIFAIPVPDFGKMKKAELVTYYQQHVPSEQHVHNYSKETKASLVSLLKAIFPDPEALDTPDVTGYDPADPIDATVAEVHSFKSETEAIEYIHARADSVQLHYFQIGGALAEMQTKGWMSEHDDFWGFVEAEFGFKKRKTFYLIKLFQSLSTCGASFAEFKYVGWSKLAILASADQLTPDTYKGWIAMAKEATFDEIHAMLKDNVETEEKNSTKGAESTPTVSKKFIVHEDQLPIIEQALDKAKKAGSTEYDGMALEYIAMDYLGGPVPVKQEATAAPATGDAVINADSVAVQLRSLIKQSEDAETALEIVLEAVEEVFTEHYPNLDIEVYPDGQDDIDEDEVTV